MRVVRDGWRRSSSRGTNPFLGLNRTGRLMEFAAPLPPASTGIVSGLTTQFFCYNLCLLLLLARNVMTKNGGKRTIEKNAQSEPRRPRTFSAVATRPKNHLAEGRRDFRCRITRFPLTCEEVLAEEKSLLKRTRFHVTQLVDAVNDRSLTDGTQLRLRRRQSGEIGSAAMAPL